MAAPTTYPSDKQFIGVGKETTPGTAVAMVATLPVDSFEPEDKATMLWDQGNRGSMVEQYAGIQGVKINNFSFKGAYFGDGAGYWLNNILGDITTTGSTPPYSHALSLLNTGTAQPGTLTITDWQGLPATTLARQYAGSVLSELTISGSVENELVQIEGKGTGWASIIAAAAPTSAPTTALPMAAWRSTVNIGGSADATIGDWEIKISRKIKPYFTAQNSQNPYVIQRGALSLIGKLTFAVPATEANAYLAYINNTQPAITIAISNGGSGAGLLSFSAQMSVCAFDSSKIDRGAEAVGYATTFVPVGNTTDVGASGGYSPCKITIQNALASGTF